MKMRITGPVPVDREQQNFCSDIFQACRGTVLDYTSGSLSFCAYTDDDGYLCLNWIHEAFRCWISIGHGAGDAFYGMAGADSKGRPYTYTEEIPPADYKKAVEAITGYAEQQIGRAIRAKSRERD